MEPLQILLWAIGAAFGINFALLSFMWHGPNHRFDKLDKTQQEICHAI
jgi:hypothetical protein